MKNWPLVHQVAFGTCTIVIFFGIICGIVGSKSDGFGIGLGLACLGGAILASIAAVICAIASFKGWDKGFLLSAGLLFLLSGISCGGGVVFSIM